MEKMLGVMLDNSRNAVMKPDTIKRFADIIKKMAYNTIMLYIEDTYEIDGHPYFGCFRGRYSKDELKEIDRYCSSIGIELVPCIQTLAHVNSMFKWKNEYADIYDCDDILLVDEAKTYELIEAMVSSVAECFSTRKIHIGMDEAIHVGLGKYKKLHGEKDRFEIIRGHLEKVCEIVKKYDFEPMIWSDMFCKLAFDIDDQFAEADTSKIHEKAKLPENVSLVYWDYYSTDYERYARNIKTNKLFDRKVYFSGGVWTWRGISPDNTYSIETTKVAIRACNDCGVDGIFFTLWGDDGAECSKFSVLPALMYAAELVRGNTDSELIKSKFKDITGYDFDSFMLFDKLIHIGGKHPSTADPSKYLLYNDLFLGTRDYLCSETDSEHYKALSQEILKFAGKDEYGYLFEFYGKLADALSIKCDLGKKIREAYQKKNLEALKELTSACTDLNKKLNELFICFRSNWHYENKPHGFEVQDLRYGGLMQRIKSCGERLCSYLNGDIAEIPELEEPMPESQNGEDWFWRDIVTPNILSH
ncbi:MAG: beta-N-acetylhexosaminidase [Clostridia bacterium]|nr:beta-N-acetylhexosaminidase [Clostridia bacterium]